MRRILCFSVLLPCLLVPRAGAISLEGIGVSGAIANVNSDLQFDGAELLDVDSMIGYNVGVSFRFRWSRRSRFDIMPEAWLQQAGFSFGDRDFVVNYLQLPLLLRSGLGGQEGIVYVVFGPSLGIRLDDGEQDIQQNYDEFVLAGEAGIGALYPISRHLRLRGEFRFHGDLTDAYQREDEDDTLQSVRHRVFQFAAGLEF